MDSDPIIPDSLADRLRGVYTRPATADARTLREAGVLLAANRRRHLLLRWSPLAAAAAVGIAFVLFAPRTAPPGASGPAGTIASARPGDLNGDGRIDILDALIIARDLRSASTRPDEDFDGDGAVTAADVDALAAAAVKLEKHALGGPTVPVGLPTMTLSAAPLQQLMGAQQ